jgi:DNA-binding CsgD family transcriptional regulator
LGKAADHIDFIRIFRKIAAEGGFEHFALLCLSNRHAAETLADQVVLHSLPAGLVETYDGRHRFSETSFCNSFYRSTSPLTWIPGRRISPADGTDFLSQIGYDCALTIPLHTTAGARYIVLFLGDDEIDGEQQGRLCLQASAAFDTFQRIVLGGCVQSELTARETEILRWISFGKTASEIAEISGVSEHTVNSHTAAILKKLDAVNRTQMVAEAIRRQLIR